MPLKVEHVDDALPNRPALSHPLDPPHQADPEEPREFLVPTRLLHPLPPDLLTLRGSLG